MMRRITVLALLLIVSLNGFSQVERPRHLPAFDYKPLHWGFTVGLNSMDFAIKRNTAPNNFVFGDVSGFQPAGFQVNIVSDLRLSEFWNLRALPGINLGSRHFHYYDPNTQEEILDMTLQSSFLDFPVLLKYRSVRVNNYRPYVIGGLSLRYDMSTRTKSTTGGVITNDDIFLLKRADLYAEMGFGVDTYLQYFKFAPEIKVAVGLRNMLLDEEDSEAGEYLTSFSSLRSILIMINFHFE